MTKTPLYFEAKEANGEAKIWILYFSKNINEGKKYLFRSTNQ
jgi:hypothetical protein